MIPAGILSQDSRDLSKEIWISWGNGYAQDGQVYCNGVNYLTQNSPITLKNAKGDDTDFRLINYANTSENLSVTDSGSGTLDIINRRSLNISYDEVNDIYGGIYIQDITYPSPKNIEISVLNGRQSSSYDNGYIGGWGISLEEIDKTSAPVQTKMEVTDDWVTYSSLVTNNFLLTIGTEYYSYQIRAIVIKLL